jgi:hypothetical protein
MKNRRGTDNIDGRIAAGVVEVCPYCLQSIETGSRDHIFSDFLGGRRRIPACKQCNSLFGHTFEAESAKILRPFYISLNSWGLPIPDLPMMKAIHKDAEGREIDLVFSGDGPRPRLSRPEINRDDDGNIVSGFVRDQKEAQRIAVEIEKTGKFQRVMIEERPLDVDFGTFKTVTTFGGGLKRTALKMCVALATLMRHFDPRHFAGTTALLRNIHANLGTRAAMDLRIHERLDAIAIPLAHSIYVEYGRECVYGIVQFFGDEQIFCILSEVRTSTPCAMLGTLDPLTSVEKFEEVIPLEIPQPRIMFRREEMTTMANARLERLRKAAITRGAKDLPVFRHEAFVAPTLPMFSLESNTSERTVFLSHSNTWDIFSQKS